jgi:hypothetical protein
VISESSLRQVEARLLGKQGEAEGDQA